MGLKECEIVFDNPSGAYYAGQTVNGRVLFSFDTPKKVRGICIKFKGESNTQWTIEETRTNQENQTENERIEVSGSEEYFKIQYYLVGGPSGGEHELGIGRQEYPFTCVLPPTLPSSFEGKFGHVRYTVKVVLDRPWKFDQEVKAAFTVLSPLDLNMNSSLKEPVRIEMEKYFCCLCCKSGPLTCVVSLPARGFVPGQTIPLLAEVDNISNVQVISVAFIFQKAITYHSQTPRRETKKEVIELEKLIVGPVEGHESKTWNQPMVIPPLPPSNLVNCSLIDLDYEIHVEATVSGMHTNLKSTIPLTIGTVPFSDIKLAPTAPPPESPTNNPPSDGNYGWNFNPSQYGPNTIKDKDDSEYTNFSNGDFRPMYPVFNFTNNA